MAGPDDPEDLEEEPARAADAATGQVGSDAMSRRLATQIERDVESPLPWRSIAKKSVVVAVAGVTIYLVFPSLTEVFGSFPKLTSLDPIWFSIAVVLQVAHFACTIALQRIALRTKAWFSVATSQLAGNAISLVVPGGAAFGAATQFRMLAASGSDTATAVGGLTAFSLLGIGGLLALPIFVLPAILAGTPVASGLQHAALLGIVAFVLFAGFGALVLATDGPLRWAGRIVQATRNRLKRKAEPMTGLPDRLVYERNRIRVVLGRRWKEAALLSSGRLAFDFGTLLATIRATGAKPNPSLVLLAYAVAGLLALIPITPGGLGIVEAGLSALLILAGISGGDAVVATLAYRIISYWLPIFVGPFAYLAFRLRYGRPGAGGGAAGSGGPVLAAG
ncbi:MAG: UPF0104 family protein [Acidimicrobiales bacterium]|nr:UPF0104 family protein [Acidimicrobiales bacterium]